MGLFDFIFGNKKKKAREVELRRKHEAEQKRQKMFAEIRKRQEERKKEERQKQEKEALGACHLEERCRKEMMCKEENRHAEDNNKKEKEKDCKAYLAIFSANWCGPSKRFIKEIQEAGINYFTIIDVEKEVSLSEKYGINSVPTTILFDENKNILKKWVGYDDEDPGQSQFVNYIINSPYSICPLTYSSDKETAPKRKEAKGNVLFKEIDESTSIKEDHRTHFYDLEDIKYRSMGEDLMLVPYDAFSYLNFPDSEVLYKIADTDKIRRFLPGLGFTDEASTKKRLESFVYKVEKQLGVTYVIRFSNIPFGMIFVNSPLYNKKAMNLAIWTIDFYISDIYEHKGLMYQSILRVLNEMKNAMGAKAVYAIVDKNNYDCINVIGKGLFNLVDNTGFHDGRGGEDPLVYMIDLSLINFQRG